MYGNVLHGNDNCPVAMGHVLSGNILCDNGQGVAMYLGNVRETTVRQCILWQCIVCNGQSDCMERGRCARDTKARRHNLCRTKPWFWFQFFQQWLNFELPMYLNGDLVFGKKYMMKPNTFKHLNVHCSSSL